MSQYACNLAIGLANLQQVMAPNIIILHGDVARGGKRLGDLIRKKFMSSILRRPGDEVNLLLGGNEDFAALRGAAGLVLSDLLNFSL